MKAAVVEEFKQPLKVKEVPDPSLRTPFDAIIHIHASGVCHTDLHAANRDWPVKPKPPFIRGHEGKALMFANQSVIGSIVGTRKDTQGTLDLAARSLVTCDYKPAKLEDINYVFNETKAGTIKGRVVLQMAYSKNATCRKGFLNRHGDSQ